MPYRGLTLAFALAIAAINLGELLYFSPGYLPRQIGLIALWAGLPAPLVWFIGTRFIIKRQAARVLLGGLGIALALGAFGAWDVTIGPGRNESLSGLIVIMMPAYQNALILVSLIVAWIVERRIRSSASAS